ncbi:MAG: efflux RND transporter periplasmic adaptor subunit [Hyphomicrobiales bacterium]|nr:efflux RND transporter periplasmic adaptor subunit [Hyphomicrobiales bacterium]
MKQDVVRRDGAEARRDGKVGKTPFVVVGLLSLAALGWGAWSHFALVQQSEATREEKRERVMKLRTIVVESKSDPVRITAPGQTLAIESARIFARATGYIVERRVDIGARVRKGDLLARISAPDVDQQLAQAQAQLAQLKAQTGQARAQADASRANSQLAGVTYGRTRQLAEKGYAPIQNLDANRAAMQAQSANVASASAAVAAADASVRAQQAIVDRLTQLQDYQRIVAPFDGIVTQRNVETGDLVSADAAGGTPLFSVARDDVLRVQAHVPQSSALGVRPGIDAIVFLPEAPGRQWPGKVARDAGALDPASRSLLVEVEAPNEKHELRPGLFVNVELAIPRPSPAVVIPAEALTFSAQGLRVATLDSESRAHFRKVAIARDFGSTVEISDGLSGGERLVLSPPADLEEGRRVDIAQK